MTRMTQFLAWVRATGWSVMVVLFTEERGGTMSRRLGSRSMMCFGTCEAARWIC